MENVGHETLKRMARAGFYNKWLNSFIKPFMHRGGEIIEVGAGIGNFTKMLATHGKVTTVDIDKRYLKKLKREKIPNTSVGFGDIEKGKYFFGTKKFNTLVCLNVLEHIEDDKKALKNMNSLLKPGGYLILLVPAHKRAFSKMDTNLGHFRRYTKKELSALVKNANFNLVSVKYLNIPGLLGWYVNGKILKREIVPSNQVGIFDKMFIPWLLLERKLKPPFGLSVFLVAQKK